MFSLLELVIGSVSLVHGGLAFNGASGLPTGLSPAVSVANLYLDSLGREVLRVFGSRLKVFWRFVDDCYTVVSRGLQIEELVDFFDSQPHGLRWTCTGSSGQVSEEGYANNSVAFLHLEIE